MAGETRNVRLPYMRAPTTFLGKMCAVAGKRVFLLRPRIRENPEQIDTSPIHTRHKLVIDSQRPCLSDETSSTSLSLSKPELQKKQQAGRHYLRQETIFPFVSQA